MSIVSWKRIREIFNEALELPAPERERYVASACGEDEPLRAEVERLLRGHEEAGEFLASPTIDAGGLATPAREEGASERVEGPGSRIGPYKILQLIGEGGFGSVYMAEQEEPIRRRVALKIIKLGMDTKEVIARFEAERQALAMMDHPHIARVLDAGATDSGRPYFAMELVNGVPITEYCDSRQLGTRERLELFADVCRAVDHAHSKGVVHRDLKPSNVMVTLHDGVPVPKVIDFGVAKATSHRLTERTLFTKYGEFIGTPAYMSPEQAEMSGLEVDRRSDIYTLGVLLYELLTGTPPFESDRLRSAAFIEVMRILREEDPPAPSTRLGTLGDRLDDVAKRRKIDPQGLVKLLRGDVDWIVMKAMEKDRTRRYASAAELADDIDRHFAHQPVTARRPGALYRARKLVKRRKEPILAAAAVVGAVMIGATLARMDVFSSAAAAESDPPVRRLIIDGEGSGQSLPTRDGRHLLRYNQEQRGYERIEIESGETEPLTTGGPDPNERLFSDHDLSPDGRTIAAVHHISADTRQEPMPQNDGGRELRVFRVGEEGEGRLLRSWGPRHNVHVFGWWPERSRLWVFVIRSDGAAEIASIALADGSVEVLKTLTWRDLTQSPSLSPDGRFIAYHHADTRQAPPDLFFIATDGSREVRVDSPSSDSRPLFSPDGSGVVFRRDGPDGADLWFLPVADGRPAGEPRVVWPDIGPYGTATVFAENGSLFYYFATSGFEIYTVDADLSAGLLEAPEQLPRRNGEMNESPAYSPDGRYLAHLRDRGRRLVLRDLGTGAEREFPIGGSLLAPHLSFCPDGRSAIVSGYRNEYLVFRVDLDLGGAERLPISGWPVMCTGDGEVVLVRRSGQSNQGPLLRRSLSSGEEQTLFDGRVVAYGLSASPDGRIIAFGAMEDDEARLMVVPTAGGEPRVLATSPVAQRSWTEFKGMMWPPDGEHLILVRGPTGEFPVPESPEVTFQRLAIDGRTAEEVGRMRLPPFRDAFYGAVGYGLRPDGSQIVFQRHTGTAVQRWAIDNLLEFIRSGATADALPRR
ncbi:MAG: protein kinase [Gemmatimonadota bacterium]|nr:protein kinase [Gemmatimonadota bacterium]